MTESAPQESAIFPRPAQMVATIIIGSLAILIFGIQPVLYAAFVAEGVIEPDGLGLLSAAEVVAIAIGSGLAIPAIKHVPVATIAGLAILLVASANYFQAHHGNADLLFACRMLAGLGSGFLVGIAGAAIAATRRVGQWAAGYLLAQAASQFLLLQSFAVLLPVPTSTDLLLSLAILSAAMLLGLPFLPPSLAHRALSDTAGDHGKPDAAGMRWLAVMFLFVGGALTIWAYAGVWLETKNVSASAAAAILSSSLAGQAVGAFAACLIRNGKHDRGRLVCTTLLLLLSAGGWLLWPGSLLAAAGFGIWWMSSVPILSAILSEVDHDRTALPFAPAAQLAGIAVIPTAAGFLFAAHDVERVLIAGCAAIAFSLFLGFAAPPRRIGALAKGALRRFSSDAISR